MTSKPKVQITRFPLKGGQNDSVTFVQGSYNGLLATSSNYKTKSGSWSGGGPFYVYKKSQTFERSPYIDWTKNGVPWKGHALSPGASTSFALPVPPTWASEQPALTALYATGFKKTRPGNPVASLGQFVAEIRDPLTVPGLLLKRHMSFRSLGSEYLNVAFGWKPFVNDLRQMYHLQQTIQKRLDQIRRENGHGIHRKAILMQTDSSINSSAHYGYAFAQCANPPPTWPAGSTDYSSTVRTYEKQWFSAKYRYYIPNVDSVEWNMRAIAVLFGTYPSPDVLWQVMPYSWLVDWFSNVGDIVSNASTNAVDNLTTQYSYTMRERLSETVNKVTTSWQAQAYSGTNIPAGNCTLSSTFRTESKQRVGGGNPFGLSTSFNSLSGYQVGILAALGLSRGLVK